MQQFSNGVLWEVDAAHVFYLPQSVWAKYLAMANAKDAYGKSGMEGVGRTYGGRVCQQRGREIRLSLAMARWAQGRNRHRGVCMGQFGGVTRNWENLADPHHQPAIGFPTSDEEGAGAAGNGPGRVVHFDGADLFWSQATGVHETYGAIRDHWNANQFLGIAITDETGTPDGVGAV